MKKFIVLFILLLIADLIIRAQTPAAPWQVGVSSATHVSCTVAASTTQYCFASDGLWVSLNGAAYVQVQIGAVVAGVTSVTVNGGAPQTGPVALTIPSKVTITSQTTSTGALQ